MPHARAEPLPLAGAEGLLEPATAVPPFLALGLVVLLGWTAMAVSFLLRPPVELKSSPEVGGS